MTQYRPDIDGLRALAVASVLAFHAFPRWLPGGFVGVDVFFVISGFLITSIILGELKKGTFTFGNFYGRRVRRIFPALVLVLAFVLAVGWYALLPADFEKLGNHVLAGAGFFSNVLLYSEGGYFDTSAALKPLLHLWSLGVEEQYYVVWPLLLFALRKHLHRIFWLILALAIGSFALSVLATPRFPDAAFYLPPTRFWELMLGGIAAYVQVVAGKSLRLPAAFAYLGLALLAASLAFVTKDESFPGWIALLPTVGTVLLISTPGSLLNEKILSARGVVYIGLISYPLYLWHWPLLSFARILNHDVEPAATLRALLLLASVLLACATYELVEKKVRYARRTRWAHRVVPSAAGAMLAAGVVGGVALIDVLPARSSSIPKLAEVSRALGDWDGYNGGGTLRGTSPRAVMFFGDSHMAQYMPRVAKLIEDGREPTRTAVYRVLYGCAPIPGVDRKGKRCERFTERGFRTAHRRDIEIVVIGASWLGFASRPDLYAVKDPKRARLDPLAPKNAWVWRGFEKRLAELTREGKRVVLMLNGPAGKSFDPRAMISRNGFDLSLHLEPPSRRADLEAEARPVDSRLRAIAARVGATVVDPFDYLCSASECPATDAAGNPRFMDDSHLRASFSRRLGVLDAYVYLHPAQGRGVPLSMTLSGE